MAMTVAQLMQEVTQLNAQERGRLLQQIKAFVGNGGGEQVETSDDLLALRCIMDALRDMGTETFGYERYKKHAGWKAFAAKVPPVLKFVRKAGDERVLHNAILSLGIKLLYQELTRAGYPVTGITIMAHFHRVPAMIEMAFPGYVKSGLLNLVFMGGNNDVRHQRNGRSQVL